MTGDDSQDIRERTIERLTKDDGDDTIIIVTVVCVIVGVTLIIIIIVVIMIIIEIKNIRMKEIMAFRIMEKIIIINNYNVC